MAGDRWLGTELAGYRIDAVVGRGGVGVVYRATHLTLRRPVALKLLADGLAADAEYRRRFEREARLAAALDHPHIVPIHDAGYTQDVLYLAMSYIDGPNMATVIDNDAPMDLAHVCALLTGVAEALDSAHRAGLVHRDVKPANILTGGRGVPTDSTRPAGRSRAYLCDFGIARSTTATSAQTTTGQFLGTLQYCAPEQIQGRPLDGLADQYALACVIYHCLTGQPPYPAGEPSALIFAHLSADRPRPSTHNPALPATVDDVIARALAKQPAHRYPDCTTFLHALAAADDAGASNAAAASAPSNPHPTPPTHHPHTVIWPPGPPQHERAGAPDRQATGPSVPPRRRMTRRQMLALTSTLGLIGVGGIGAVVYNHHDVVAQIPFPGADGELLLAVDGGLAITPDGRHAYAVAGGSVVVIDTSSHEVAATIPAPHFLGGRVAISPDGRLAYVTTHSETRGIANVLVVETASHTVTATIPLSGPPQAVAITPDSRHAYIAVNGPGLFAGESFVVVIDTASNAVAASISAPPSREIAIPRHGQRAYVGGPGLGIQVIDTASSAVLDVIPTDFSTPRMVVTPDGTHILSADIAYDNLNGTSDLQMHVIDTASRVTASRSLPSPGSPASVKTVRAIGIDPDGRYAYIITNSMSRENGKDTREVVVVVDVLRGAIADTFSPGVRVHGEDIAVTPDGRHLYLHTYNSIVVLEA